jgi:hypothetical protein
MKGGQWPCVSSFTENHSVMWLGLRTCKIEMAEELEVVTSFPDHGGRFCRTLERKGGGDIHDVKCFPKGGSGLKNHQW